METFILAGGAGFLGGSFANHCEAKEANFIVMDKVREKVEVRGGGEYMALDLTSSDQFEAALSQVVDKTQGAIHLVNFSGKVGNSPVMTLDSSPAASSVRNDWQKMFVDNLFPVVTPTLSFCRIMASAGREGSVVQLSSINAQGAAGQSAYAAAKAAVEVATRSLSLEFGPLGLRLNSIRVGYMDSPSLFANLSPEKVKTKIGRTALRRLGDSNSLNELIWALSVNAFMSGATISFDGGSE
jgi:3-oxoacyl-[acyl-carrier protein] reductase